MAKVIYFDANLNGKVFDVLKENADGTVDIGTGATLAVGGCVLVTEPKHGHGIRCLAPAMAEDGGQKPELQKPEEGEPKVERAKSAK